MITVTNPPAPIAAISRNRSNQNAAALLGDALQNQRVPLFEAGGAGPCSANRCRHHEAFRTPRRIVACTCTRSARCRWLIASNRFCAWGFPFGPSIRIRLFDGILISAPSRSNPIVALM